jgi:hypothetical protein
MRGTWRGDPLLETLGDVYRKALESGISLHRDPTGEPGQGFVYRGLRKRMKEGSRSGASLSERGNLEGGLLYWGSRRIC